MIDKEKYLKNDGNCPFCGVDNCYNDGFFGGKGCKTLIATMSCSSCLKEWHEIYELTEIEKGRYAP